MIWTILLSVALVGGVAIFALGVVCAFISASVNMSFNNPLPRAGCAFLLGGSTLVAVGIWGLRT